MSNIPNGYFEIVIRITKDMPPTSVWQLKRKLQEVADGYSPKGTVKVEEGV
jgi:hypothetical protein